MRRIFITTLLISLIGLFNLTAQERIYTPELSLPANGAVNQMPDVVLDWNAVTGGNTGIIIYDIQLDTDPAFPHPTNFQTELLSAYKTSLLLFSQTYFWRVRAVDGNDVSGWSETWSFSVISRVVLTAPADAATKNTEVTFEWNQITGTTAYELQLDTAYFWKMSNSGQTGILYSVFTLDSTHAWIVGAGGVILFFDGTSWNEQESTVSTDLNDAAFLDANNGWAVGKSGKIVHYDGTAWTAQTSGTTADLFGVAILDANNGWAVGKGGIIRYYNGTDWISQDTLTTKDFTKIVAVDASHIWASGKGGVVAFNNGSGWSLQVTGTPKDINALDFASADHGWAVGKSGLLLEFNTGTWKIYDNGQTYPDLFGVNFTSPDNGWAVGKSGTVLQFDGTAWFPQTAATNTTINGISLYGGSFGFMVGEAGLVMRYKDDGFSSPIAHTYTIPDTILTTTIINLPFGAQFFWRMRAKHSLSTSPWSGARSFNVQAKVILDKPSDGSVGQNLDVLLKWKKYSNLVTYEIEIDDNPAYSAPISLASTDISINAVQLKFGIKYYWRVRALHVSGTSAWTDSWTFTTSNNVTLVSPANGAVNVPLSPPLTWTAITGIAGYEVQFNENNDFTAPMISAMVPDSVSSFFVPIVLEKDADYFWRVRAVNGLDTSAWSSVWSFTTIPPVGIDEQGLGERLAVYPNPAEYTLYLQLLNKQKTSLEFRIYDLVGKTVLKQNIQLDSGNRTVPIDVSSLQEGIYLIRMSDMENVFTKKLVIKR